jgi:hypothetical protein
VFFIAATASVEVAGEGGDDNFYSLSASIEYRAQLCAESCERCVVADAHNPFKVVAVVIL